MPRNVEIKARPLALDACERRARSLAGGEATVIRQEDFFFNCPNGRLKLRLLAANHGQLIHYFRPDQKDPGISRYTIVNTAEPQALFDALAGACGVRGVVRKTRDLYLIGRARVHIDRVEGLGGFVELEVVLEDGERESDGVDEAEALMREFNIGRGALIESAYIDMLGEPPHPVRPDPEFWRAS